MEAELIAAWTAGTVVDCGGADVEADLLRRFLIQPPSHVDPRGVRLTDAAVTGVLDLAGVALDFPLRLQACTFTDAPMLAGASLPELAMTDSPRLPGLVANNLRVQRDVDLSRSQVVSTQPPGQVRIAPIHLSEAEIGGRLVFSGTTIRAESGRAIYADRARVGSSVRFLDGFE